MQPLPEVRAELGRLSALLGEGMDIAKYLNSVAKVAEAVVPACLGVSITLVIDGDPFTVTATSPLASAMDAVQDVDSGPCIHAITVEERVEVDDLLSEQRWHLFAQAAGDRGVRATLSFPIRDMGGLVAGGMNLYSGAPDAFAGRGRMIEVAFGADLNEAVSNADLSFATRELARDLPRRLQARTDVDLAVGSLAELRDWTPAQARARLERAAVLTGTQIEDVARLVLAVATGPEG
jgi:GAF domain-containing protein